MERVVAAARSNVDIVSDPDLALTLADQLAAIIAEAKELKSRQQALLSAQMVKTQEMAVLANVSVTPRSRIEDPGGRIRQDVPQGAVRLRTQINLGLDPANRGELLDGKEVFEELEKRFTGPDPSMPL